MTERASGFDPVEELVDAFLDRYRRGERPSITEYTTKHPELAERIRVLFPALVVIEELGSDGDLETGRQTARSSTGDPVPQRLGDYLLLRPIGSGGMGTVYEAIQEPLGRHVALKVLPFHRLGDPTRLERFRREARAAARLHHTHIVPVFGVGEHEGLHYYTMQFIQGHGLDDVLREVKRLRRDPDPPAAPEPSSGRAPSTALALGLCTGLYPAHEVGESVPLASVDPAPSLDAAPASSASPSPSLVPDDRSELSNQPEAQYLRSVARIGVQVAEALEYAHGQGILHRDIKPSNLLLDAQGQVWITDFGLAKAQDSDELTRTGDIVGTLRYMAPERFNGWSDPRSDVYALGATLHELATLRTPFEESDRIKLVERVLRENPVPPRQMDRRVPRDLETIVLKALAKEPGERYATAGDLADDLRRFIAGEPIRARRIGWAERGWRWSRRNPVQTTLGGSVAVLLLGISIVLPVAALLRDERNFALVNLDRARLAEGGLRLEQSRSTAAGQLSRARAHRFSGQAGQRFQGLEELAAAARIAPSLELRNEAIACLALTDVRLAKAWEAMPPGTYCFLLDETFERYVRGDQRGNLSIRRLSDDQELMILPGPGHHAYFLKFSPDGRFLAASYDQWDGGSMVWDLGSGRPILKPKPLGLLDFRPDSRGIALSPGDGTIRIVDIVSGRSEKIIPSVPGRHYFAFDPSGRFLAVIRAESPRTLWVISPVTGEEVRTVPLPVDAVHMGWSRDSRFLAVTAEDHRIFVFDFESGTMQSELTGHESLPNSVAFSRSDDLLASSGWDSTLRLWEPLTGRPLLRIDGGGGPPQFRPDAPWLAGTTNGSKFEIWELARGSEACRILGGPSPNGPIHSVEFSPDGRLLLAASSQGVWLWDWANGRDIAVLPGGQNFATFRASEASLLTGGNRGLLRWPIRKDPDIDRESLLIGPPGLLFASSDIRGIQPVGEGTRIAFADRDRGKVVLADCSTDADMATLGDLANVSQVATSPDGRWVAAGTVFGTGAAATVWDVRNRTLAWQSPEPRDGNVRFSPDGRWLVTGTPRSYRFWKVGSWEPGPSISRDHAGMTRGAIAFTREGRMMAIAQSARLVRLVDVARNQELASLEAPRPGIINDLAFSPDDSQLAVGCEGHEIQVWDLRFLRRNLAAIGLDWEQPPLPSGPAPASRTLHARALPADSHRGRPRVIAALRMGEEVHRFLGPTDVVKSVAISLDGRLAMAAVADATIRIWDVETGDARRILRVEAGSVNDAAFAPDGRRVLSAHSGGTLRLWDRESGEEIRRFTGHTGEVQAVVFSRDGGRALSGGADHTLRLWDVATGQELRRLEGHTMGVRTVALSPDGCFALSGGADGSMRLWNLTSGQEVRRFEAHTAWVEGVAFSPDGRRALCGGGAGRILRLFDLETGDELHRYHGHTAYVQRVAFSPDGRFALSGGADRTLRLWNVETARELIRFQGHEGTVRSVAFTPDGRFALSGGTDKTVRLWRLPPEH